MQDAARIQDIIVPEGRREPAAEAVAALANSIDEVGLLNPITVDRQLTLIAGRTRLEACRSLDWDTIPIRTVELDADGTRYAELSENLHRSNETALERGQHLAEMKRIYLSWHPETAKGQAQAAALNRPDSHVSDPESLTSFTEEAAANTGQSRRHIERLVALAEKLTPAAQTQIAGTKCANSPKALKQLASLPPKQQEKMATLLGQGKAKSLEDAKKKLGITKPKPVVVEDPQQIESFNAQGQVKIWYQTIGRWLSGPPSIDQYRKKWPGSRGDRVVKLATSFYEALKDWVKDIK